MVSIVVTGYIRQIRYFEKLFMAHVPEVRAVGYDDSKISLLRAAAHALHAHAALHLGGLEPKALIRALCDARNCPVIHVWTGTDVLQLAESPADVERLRLLNLVHWSVSPNLVTELAPFGIDAHRITLAAASVPHTLAPLPAVFTVLAYLPKPRREFYGQRAIWQAASAMPDVRFLAVGAGDPEPGAPPNVQYLGEVLDIDKYIDASSVVVRMTPHDGLAQNVVEALARGRHVIWTQPLTGVISVRSESDMIAELQKLSNAHNAGLLDLNHDGASYVSKHHEPDRVARTLFAAIQDVIHATRVKSTPHKTGKIIAISGNPAFSARVARNCETYNREAVISLLSTHSTSDTALSIVSLLRSEAWYSIGAPGPRSLELAASTTRKRRIIHWLRNDINLLEVNPKLARRYRSSRFVHLAHDAGIAALLGNFGLPCTVLPLPVLPRVENIRCLPERFTLLLYIPLERPNLYGRHQYERLMHALQGESVHYIIVGGGTIEVPVGVSAERVGWRHDLAPIYDRSTALVRFAEMGSFSAMVVEALLHGRYVLSSNEFPFTTQVRNFHDLERTVRTLLGRHQRGDLAPCYDAAEEMSRRYSPEQCVRNLVAACDYT